MINNLLLLTGEDIPFPQAQLTVHQPTIKEISFIGEDNFFTGCGLLNFSKNLLTDVDKNSLINKSDFEILMSIVRDNKNPKMQKHKICMRMVLSLIFPNCKFDFRKDVIAVMDDDKEIVGRITKDNYEIFRDIVVQMLCLESASSYNYNPAGKMASQIAEKLAQGRAKAAQMKGQSERTDFLDRYLSILSIGLQIDINQLKNYTLYQLFDGFKRFELKENFDIYLRAKMAGAKDLEEVDNWMKDIHSNSDDKEDIP